MQAQPANDQAILIRVLVDHALQLHRAGKLKEAIVCYEHLLSLRPDLVDAHNNLGAALRALGDHDAAISHYKQAIAINPEYAEAHNNLANALHATGRLAEAADCYGKALAIKPGYAEAWNNLGVTRLAQGGTGEAARCYRKALELNPDHAEANKNLGNILRLEGRVEDARRLFEKSLALHESIGVRIRLATLLPVIPACTDQIREYRRDMERRLDALRDSGVTGTDPYRDVGTANFHMAYHHADDAPLQKKIADMYARLYPSLLWTAPHCLRKRRPGRKRIRLGMASTFFRNHTIGRLYLGLIENLPQDRFELVIMHANRKTDPYVDAINRRADRLVELPPNLALARKAMAEQALDILFYPDIGMEPLTYFTAFARLAPVQCVSWGHPVTTGIGNIDYFLSSKLIEPDKAAGHYNEELVQFDNLPTCYYPPELPGEPLQRIDLGLPEHGRLYICPQTLFKLHPEMDRVLAEILRRDNEGFIVLVEGIHSHWDTLYLGRFRNAFPDVAGRVLLVPKMRHEDFLRFLGMADALLDPHHFSGGNSSLEAFAQGLPIVTWPGDFMRARVTFGFYQKMGVTDLVAHDPEEYVALALRLANDRRFRAGMSRRIREKSPVLFENTDIVSEMEEFFVTAHAAARQ